MVLEQCDDTGYFIIFFFFNFFSCVLNAASFWPKRTVLFPNNLHQFPVAVSLLR